MQARDGYAIARAAKVTPKDCGTIRNAIENEVFDFKVLVSASK